jgi:serine/threonine protein kinase
VLLHGTTVCAKSFRNSSKKLIIHEASMLLQARHPFISFFLGVQTNKEPFQLLTIFYNVNGVSLSAYDAFPHSILEDGAVQYLRSKLSLEVWLALMKNLADALAFIHRKRIVHRDLKSDNVVFNKQNDEITFILVDFGKSNYLTHVKRYRTGKGNIPS